MEKQKHYAATGTIACHECDLLVKLPELLKKKVLYPGCGFLLTAKYQDTTSRILAFSSSGLLFLALALSFPCISFNAQGHERVNDLQQSIKFLFWKTTLDWLFCFIHLSLLFQLFSLLEFSTFIWQ